jgi:hypothetical protein
MLANTMNSAIISVVLSMRKRLKAMPERMVKPYFPQLTR